MNNGPRLRDARDAQELQESPALQGTPAVDSSGLAVFERRPVGCAVRLVITGRVGPRGADRLRQEMHDLLVDGERDVEIDLAGAHFDGPSGAAVLLLAVRVMRAHGGTITLVGTVPEDEPGSLHLARQALARDVEARERSPLRPTSAG